MKTHNRMTQWGDIVRWELVTVPGEYMLAYIIFRVADNGTFVPRDAHIRVDMDTYMPVPTDGMSFGKLKKALTLMATQLNVFSRQEL